MFEFLNQQQTPEDFDYRRQKKNLEQRKAAAQKLNDFRWGGDLTLTNGGYAYGGMTNPLSTLATIGANIAGAKLLANNQKEEEDLEKASEELYRRGLQALRDIKENPTDAEKAEAEKIQTLRMFGEDPPDYRSPAQEPGQVEMRQDAPAQAPAPALAPKALKRAGAARQASSGSGRGGQGGPTAEELAAANAARIDAENLRSPLQVSPSNDVGNGIRSPFMAGRTTSGQEINPNVGRDQIGPGGNLTPQQIERMAAQGVVNSDEANLQNPIQVFEQGGVIPQDGPYNAGKAAGNPYQVGRSSGLANPFKAGQAAGNPYQVGRQALNAAPVVRDNVGIDEIGVSQMTPQQIEAQVKKDPKYVPPQSVLPAATAARQAQEAGAGRGGQGGPAVGQAVEPATDVIGRNLRQMEEQAAAKQREEAIAANREEVERIAAEKAKNVRKSVLARTERAKEMLARSGEKGQKLVDAMNAAEFADLTTVENRQNLVVVGDRLFDTKTRQFLNAGKPQVYKEGDYVQINGRLVRIGGQGGVKIKETYDGPQGRMAVYEDGSVRLLDQNSRGAAEERQRLQTEDKKFQLNREVADGLTGMVYELISSGDVEHAAASPLNAAGSVLNRAVGMNTRTAEARSRIDALKAKMLDFAIQKMAEVDLATSKMMDTPKEKDALIASLGNLDYERLGEAALKQELIKFANRVNQWVLKFQSSGGAPVNSGRSPGNLAW